MIYERIKTEHQRIQKQMQSIQKELKKLPEGKLICSHSGKYCKWYHRNGDEKKHIPKKNRAFAEKLAQKKYLSCLLDDLTAENRALEFYLRHHHESNGKTEKLLTEPSGFQELLAPYFRPKSQEIADWMNAPYETNPHYSSDLNHKTFLGNCVRSKSEELIQFALHTHQIPFRYECALELNSQIIYPDFTILHPEDLEVYYWEHFGLMDNPDYISKACSKLHSFASNGIIPSVNLIVTYETKEHPLSSEMIDKIIQYYFL